MVLLCFWRSGFVFASFAVQETSFGIAEESRLLSASLWAFLLPSWHLQSLLLSFGVQTKGDRRLRGFNGVPYVRSSSLMAIASESDLRLLFHDLLGSKKHCQRVSVFASEYLKELFPQKRSLLSTFGPFPRSIHIYTKIPNQRTTLQAKETLEALKRSQGDRVDKGSLTKA